MKITEPIPCIALRLRDNNFDLLRLIFASMVVVFHAGILAGTPSLAWMHGFVSATFAVQAFFVVSGFLVTMSFENSSSLKSYASKRLRRIAPPYVLVVLTAAVLLSTLSTLPASEYFAHRDFWRYIGFNLLLSNFTAPSLPGVFVSNAEQAVNASLWTIKIEVAFYCLVPAIVWAVRRYGYQYVLTMIFVLSILWKVGLGQLAVLQSAEIYAKLAKQLPGQLAFFVGGALAYYRTLNGKKPASVYMFVLGIAAYVLTDGVLNEVIAPIAVTMVVYWAAIGAPWMLHAGKYGDFSYGIYLYHFPLVQMCVALGFFSFAPTLTVASLFVVVIALAVMSWHFVERPLLPYRVAVKSTALA